MNSGPKESISYTAQEWAMFALFPVIKMLGVPPTQPFAKIGAEQQKQVGIGAPRNFWQTGKYIYNIRGAMGFFDGTFASMTREGLKTSYKGPLQVEANDFAISIISADTYGSHFLRGAAAGAGVGAGDAFASAIPERYKMFKILNPNITFRKFINQVYQLQHGSLVSKATGFVYELHRGMGATITKQIFMNTGFFTAKEWANKATKPYKKDHPGMSMAFNSLFPGFCAAAVGGPFDVLKTLTQQKTGDKKKIKAQFVTVLQKAGWRGLLAGVGPKTGLILWGYTINGLFLNIFEEFRSSKPSKAQSETSNQSLEKLTSKLGTLTIVADSKPSEPNIIGSPVRSLLTSHKSKSSASEASLPEVTLSPQPSGEKRRQGPRAV